MADKIIVLDFGSQYNQLIARRIREFGVYSELHPGDMTLAEIVAMQDVKGIIFSGGPNSVYEKDAPKFDLEKKSEESDQAKEVVSGLTEYPVIGAEDVKK